MRPCQDCGGSLETRGHQEALPSECIETLRTRLAEAEKGREHDREQFRQGVEAWQKRIKEVEKARDIWKDVADIDLKKICKLRNLGANVKKRIEAAQDTIAKRLRNCPGNFHEENPDGCKGPCQAFGCKTLRGIRDTLKE